MSFSLYVSMFLSLPSLISQRITLTLGALMVCKAFLPLHSVQFSSVAQLCPTVCDPMNRSTPGLSVQHQLPEFTQTHVHRVSDAIQPSKNRGAINGIHIPQKINVTKSCCFFFKGKTYKLIDHLPKTEDSKK